MASSHITVPSSTPHGGTLNGLIAQWRAAQNTANTEKAVYDSLALGGDWAALGVALGLTGPTAAADAETVYNLLSAALAEINGTETKAILARLG